MAEEEFSEEEREFIRILIREIREEWEALSQQQRAAYERWARFYGYERGFLYFAHRHGGIWIEPEESVVMLIPF